MDTENSFEALAADSDDDSNYEEDWETDGPEDAVQESDKGDTDSDKSDDWEVPGECCERRCTVRMRRCFKVVQREFNLKFDTNIELKAGPAPTDAEEVEPPPQAEVEPPPVLKWTRHVSTSQYDCGCEAPAATGRSQRRRKRNAVCRRVEEVCGAIGVHIEELLSEISDALTTAMGG